jgi:hypothetical protein
MDVALGAEARRELLNRLDEFFGAFVASLSAPAAELVDERTDQ